MIVEIPLSKFLNNQYRYCYDVYELIINIIDFWEQHKKCITLFYKVNFEKPNVVFNMSMLTNQNNIIHSTMSNWRFKIDINKFELFESKKFIKNLKERINIYAFVVVGVTITKKQSMSPEISKIYLYLKKLFDNEKTRILFEQDQKDHAIDLMKNTKPLYISLYNLFQKKLTKLRRYLNDVLNKDWIKLSILFIDASILFVFKKGGKLRLCVNYKNLNAIIIKNCHSLSFITETLNRLCEVKRFTKLNLKNVYYRIRIKKNDEWKTAFRTRYEHFEYQIMSFDLTNAPITFQIYINKALRGLVDVICVIYLNDILIFNEDSTKHRRHVQQVLERLRDFELYVNLKKCEFDIEEIEFLNFIVFTKGIRMNSKRIQMIKKWSKLKTYREVQIFLRFVNFYKRFIYCYSKITALLISLLKNSENKKKKNSFEWSNEAEQAFRQLKNIFMSIFFLTHYDFLKRNRVETDVFNFAVASIFS